MWKPIVDLAGTSTFGNFNLDNVVTYASYKGSEYVVYLTPLERSKLGFSCVVRLLNNSGRAEDKDQELAGLAKIQFIVSVVLDRDDFPKLLQSSMSRYTSEERLPKLASVLRSEIVKMKLTLQLQGLYDSIIEMIDPLLVRQ